MYIRKHKKLGNKTKLVSNIFFLPNFLLTKKNLKEKRSIFVIFSSIVVHND